MQKIKSLFIRDTENPRLVTKMPDPDCAWVLVGQGRPTIKWDGTACLVRPGDLGLQALYRRHQLKEDKLKPPGWLHWDFEAGVGSGHGWTPVTSAPSDAYHREAWDNVNKFGPIQDGTYELVGPKINGNPNGFEYHTLLRHGSITLWEGEGPSNWGAIREFLEENVMEGIVWHHADGRMAKIKSKDFGLPWPVKA